MSSPKAKTIKVRLVDGDLNEVRTAQIQSTNFQAVSLPRIRLNELKKAELDIVSKQGAYILIGPKKSNNMREVYIGQSSSKVIGRLRQHNSSKGNEFKEFWESAVVFTTTDNEVNSKTKYIEKALMYDCGRNRSLKITNDNSSSYDSDQLPTSDDDFVVDFIEASKIMLLCLGYDLLQEPFESSSENSSSNKQKKNTKAEIFVCSGNDGVYAEMTIDANGGIVVAKGSIAKGTMTSGIRPKKKSDRKELIRLKVLKKHGDNFIFTKDHRFDSVSDAATQIKGSLRDGNKEWRLKEKRTKYGEWKKGNDIKQK